MKNMALVVVVSPERDGNMISVSRLTSERERNLGLNRRRSFTTTTGSMEDFPKLFACLCVQCVCVCAPAWAGDFRNRGAENSHT